jgi:hypothetical protein
MGTQFIVRSQDNKFALKRRTFLYDGVKIIRSCEDDVAIFKFDDPDLVVELVVRKKSVSDAIANLAAAALNNGADEEAKKPAAIPGRPAAKQTEVRIFI